MGLGVETSPARRGAGSVSVPALQFALAAASGKAPVCTPCRFFEAIYGKTAGAGLQGRPVPKAPGSRGCAAAPSPLQADGAGPSCGVSQPLPISVPASVKWASLSPFLVGGPETKRDLGTKPSAHAVWGRLPLSRLFESVSGRPGHSGSSQVPTEHVLCVRPCASRCRYSSHRDRRMSPLAQIGHRFGHLHSEPRNGLKLQIQSASTMNEIVHHFMQQEVRCVGGVSPFE